MSDADALLERLARELPGLVGADAVEVERTRSVGDRLAGRPGAVSALTFSGDGVRLTARAEGRDGSRLACEAARVSGGVVIARRQPPLGEWLAALSEQVAVRVAAAAGDSATAAQALAALGLATAGSDVVVDEAHLDAGLAALPARVATRLPAEAAARVHRITDIIRDTLPRAGGNVDVEFLLTRAAVDYLPSTLRAYLALPADWAATHPLRGGVTAEGELLDQLGALETGLQELRDGVLEGDAAALQTQGRFLAARFAAPSIEL